MTDMPLSFATPNSDGAHTDSTSAPRQTPAARPVSYMSNFFTREAAGGAATETLDTDTPAATRDMDLVGALGSLDLDFELSKPKDSTAASTPFQSHFYDFSQQLYAYPPAGSLTPNTHSMGHRYGSAPGTWSNFVPASAPQPPLAHKNDLMAVRPFELPDDNKDANGTLNMPFTTPPPQFGGATFGGNLESFRTGGPLPVADQLDFRAESSSESDLDGSSADRATPGQSVSRSFSTSGTPGGTPGSMADFHPFEKPYEGSPQFGEVPIGSMMLPVAMPMWPQQQQQPQQPPQPQQQQGRHNRQFNGRYSSNRRNMYDGMNVHRKVSRRRGDDAAKYANAKLSDFSGDIYSLCKDQHGCRFLQRQLELGGKENNHGGDPSRVVATIIFNEIYLRIVDLMVDPFGNYLIQKLFEHVSTDQRVIMVKNAAPEFMRVALDSHGTRALQKLVECISTDEECLLLVSALSLHVVALSRDLNGNHVVQKCLQRLSPANSQFIFDAAATHCNEIATHRHGCCVLQRCLDHGTPAQRTQLAMRVAQNATNLLLDPFGNYVVQYVLTRGDLQSIEVVLAHIGNSIVTLSLHKFGSNVIEKSLRIAKLTDTLVAVLLANLARFGDMLNDAYGNYVLQTSLDVANAADLRKLSDVLQPLLPNIKNTPHGRRIMAKIQSIA